MVTVQCGQASAVLDDLNSNSVVERLRIVATAPALSASVRFQAQELADRLTRGVRIVVLGMRGVGKSTLCDAIIGIADAPNSPCDTRVFGRELELEAMERLSGLVRAQSQSSKLLGHVQLVDLALPNDAAKHHSQIIAGLEIADIVLWCTQDFTSEESKLWAHAPDALKDHSFLVLTKADIFAEQSALQAHVASVENAAAEEFLSLFPTTTNQVRHLQLSGSLVPEKLFAASGLEALVKAISTIVSSGQRADLDSGLLFLEHHGAQADDQIVPSEQLVVPQKDTETEEYRQACTKPPFHTVRAKIMERSFDLAELSFDEPDEDMTDVLELCSAISEELVETIREDTDETSETDIWAGVFEDASDKITLMTVENETRSAADAVTILLQLRRDLEYLSVR